MSRQVAIGALIGFALAVLVLAVWKQPGAAPAPEPIPASLPRLETRDVERRPPPSLRHHREVYEFVPRDGGR